MTRGIAVGACIAILLILTAAWRVDPGAQTPAQGQVSKASAGALDPCVGRPTSPECLVFRLDRVDSQLGSIETAVRELQARAARSLSPGPSISMPLDPGPRVDANSAYLQQRIDALARTVGELVNRANVSGR